MSGQSQEVAVRPATLREAARAARALAQDGLDTSERLGGLVSRLPQAMGRAASADGFARFAARWAQNFAGTMGELKTAADRLDAAANHYDKTDVTAAATVDRVA